MVRFLARSLSLLMLVTFSVTALAAPKVSVQVSAEKQVTQTDASGKTLTKRVPASDIKPGETLFYTITYKNQGDESAHNVNIDNPVPDGTSYVPDSAWGKGADILYSIDGGHTYKKPGELTYDITDSTGKKVRKTAPVDRYTGIRWVIGEIPPGTEGQVGFEAEVK